MLQRTVRYTLGAKSRIQQQQNGYTWSRKLYCLKSTYSYSTDTVLSNGTEVALGYIWESQLVSGYLKSLNWCLSNVSVINQQDSMCHHETEIVLSMLLVTVSIRPWRQSIGIRYYNLLFPLPIHRFYSLIHVSVCIAAIPVPATPKLYCTRFIWTYICKH